MNRKQTIVMWIGIIAFVLMGLFPAWMCAGPGGGYVSPVSIGEARYTFVLPHENNIKKLCRVDVSQLCAQWAMVAVITGGLIVTLKDKKE